MRLFIYEKSYRMYIRTFWAGNQNKKAFRDDLSLSYGTSVLNYGTLVLQYGNPVDKYGTCVLQYGNPVCKYRIFVLPCGKSVFKYGNLVLQYGTTVCKYGRPVLFPERAVRLKNRGEDPPKGVVLCKPITFPARTGPFWNG
jgi:hypothetical protein